MKRLGTCGLQATKAVQEGRELGTTDVELWTEGMVRETLNHTFSGQNGDRWCRKGHAGLILKGGRGGREGKSRCGNGERKCESSGGVYQENPLTVY